MIDGKAPKGLRDYKKVKRHFFLDWGLPLLLMMIYYSFFRNFKLNQEKILFLFQDGHACSFSFDNFELLRNLI